MLKKQEDFEKMLAAQEEKFHQLNRETKVRQKAGVSDLKAATLSRN